VKALCARYSVGAGIFVPMQQSGERFKKPTAPDACMGEEWVLNITKNNILTLLVCIKCQHLFDFGKQNEKAKQNNEKN
jgi:hypothetical protein